MTVEKYHERLRAMRACVVCILLQEGRGQCDEIHHVGDPNTERNDWAVVPLCDRHHQGSDGIHRLRRRGFFKESKLSDVTLLAMTTMLFAKEWGR